MATTALGRLACQKNSFLKELSAKVVSCMAVPNSNSQYDVVFNDSVLFPEGGGQPGDTGTLLKKDHVLSTVIKSFTQDGKCVIRTDQEMNIGEEVLMQVNWPRRLDHMQQHSAQHLISAIAKKNYDLNTTTWSLGVSKCNVEFDSTTLSPAQLDALEAEVNEVISNARPVSFHYKEPTSDVRVVVIDGLDMNTCCGTHVQHTGQLQSVKFLGTEIARGCTRVWFIAGNRVLSEFAAMFERERQATKLWSCPPEEHIERLQKLLQAQNIAAKAQKATKLELGELLAHQLLVSSSSLPFATLHRDDGDAAFLQVIASTFNTKNSQEAKILFLTGGSSKGDGFFLLTGPDSFVSENGKAIADILDGKGGGRKGVFQGKCKSMSNLPQVYELLVTLTTA